MLGHHAWKFFSREPPCIRKWSNNIIQIHHRYTTHPAKSLSWVASIDQKKCPLKGLQTRFGGKLLKSVPLWGQTKWNQSRCGDKLLGIIPVLGTNYLNQSRFGNKLLRIRVPFWGQTTYNQSRFRDKLLKISPVSEANYWQSVPFRGQTTYNLQFWVGRPRNGSAVFALRGLIHPFSTALLYAAPESNFECSVRTMGLQSWPF